MKMLSSIFLVAAITMMSDCQAQCTANAGVDTIMCTGFQPHDTIALGGTPVVTGGMAPFTYSWQAHDTWGFGQIHHIWASDMLDDTTLAHPRLISAPVSSELNFMLTVTDSNGDQCTDTVLVRFSGFGTTLGYCNATILQGDSFQFICGTNVDGSFGPLTYVWHPNQHLSDSTSLTAWASPPVSTDYSLTATDIYGCQIEASPLYYITVLPVGISDIDEVIDIGFTITPTPMHSSAMICLNGQIGGLARIKLFSSLGKLIRSEVMSGTCHELEREDLPAGTYMLVVQDPERILGRGKLVIE